MPRVKQIWSRNKSFVADVFFDQKVTRIGKVDWQGNMGRTTPLWSMNGTFASGWLADDGAHAPREVNDTVALEAGLHPITIRYFQGGGGKSIALACNGAPCTFVTAK